MNPTRIPPAVIALLAILCAAPAVAQFDVVTVGTVNASGSTVDVPIYIRDGGGSPLGVDRPAGSRIQAFSIKVTYAPASAVTAATIGRAGITASLSPTSEFKPASPPSISILDTFEESTNPIPFSLNAPLPGNLVAHLVLTLSASAAPGSTITLTLDPALTQLTDQGGSAATKETVANGALKVVNGAVNIPPLSIAIVPSSIHVEVGRTSAVAVTASSAVSSDTTVTLALSKSGVATAPASVLIGSGSRTANFTLGGVAVGSASLTASLPASAGGATATATVNVTVPCATLSPPTLRGPSSVQAGTAYTISWDPVAGSTDYSVEEATDPTFAGSTTTTAANTTATFTHSAGTYFYRVRSHAQTGSCDVTSIASDSITVTISSAVLPLKSYLAVVGSVPGSFGSFFRTSLQLYNPKTAAVSGRIVFHAQGASGSDTDPSLAYSIPAHGTLSFADLLPAMGITSGLGSADIAGDVNSDLPIALAHVFNDAGAAGTTGLTEGDLNEGDALSAGDIGALLVPADLTRFRLNVGIRTLDEGATLAITVTDKDGNVVKSATKSYSATFFFQAGASTLLDGYALAGGETISVQIMSGSAFVYGSTIDNTSNDPSIQFARR